MTFGVCFVFVLVSCYNHRYKFWSSCWRKFRLLIYRYMRERQSARI